MTDVQKCFIAIIKDVVIGGGLPEDFEICDLKELYRLAEIQDMAHIIAYGLKKHNLIDLDTELWKQCYNKQYSLAQYRVANLEYEYERVCKVLEEAEIDYLPLKGAVIRPLYPEPWMRVSCDIDILVHEEDLQKAENVLINKLGYTLEHKDSKYGHHDHIKSQNGFIIEMHFSLTDRNVKARVFSDDVWNRVELFNGTRHQYVMNNSMFYLFHILHAAIHFKEGGCGIKAVLDTFFINHKLDINSNNCKEILEKSDLHKFALILECISEKWFSDSYTDRYDTVEEYILSGGVYGSENHYAAWQAETNGKSLSYYVKRTFPKYEFMRQRYSELDNKPFLLPYFWIKRIYSALSEKDKNRTEHEIKTVWLEKEKSKKIKMLFDELDL